MGIPISRNCDIKYAHNWSKSQRAFLSFYGAPKFRALSKFCGKTKLYTDLMEKNFNFWGGTIMVNTEESSKTCDDDVKSYANSFTALKESLNKSNPNFRLALKRVCDLYFFFYVLLIFSTEPQQQ